MERLNRASRWKEAQEKKSWSQDEALKQQILREKMNFMIHF